MALPAETGGVRPAITRRAAASSGASIVTTIDAPCVLASLGARDPHIHRLYRKDHPA